MLNRNEELKQYLVPGKHVHLVGIGGVSMRPLGLVLRAQGLTISGSDMNASVSTDELIRNGITVHIGHKVLRTFGKIKYRLQIYDLRSSSTNVGIALREGFKIQAVGVYLHISIVFHSVLSVRSVLPFAASSTRFARLYASQT